MNTIDADTLLTGKHANDARNASQDLNTEKGCYIQCQHKFGSCRIRFPIFVLLASMFMISFCILFSFKPDTHGEEIHHRSKMLNKEEQKQEQFTRSLKLHITELDAQFDANQYAKYPVGNQREILREILEQKQEESISDCVSEIQKLNVAAWRERQFKGVNLDKFSIAMKTRIMKLIHTGKKVRNIQALKTKHRNLDSTCIDISLLRQLKKLRAELEIAQYAFANKNLKSDKEEAQSHNGTFTKYHCKGYDHHLANDLVGSVGNSFSIIVLTMDRPDSLKRLLTSLKYVEYLGHNIHLYINIDRPLDIPNLKYEEVLNIANSFEWNFGKKMISKRIENQGLAMSWFNAWNDSIEGNFIILEDDCEVSSCFYIWLQSSWCEYGKRNDIYGISLQRQWLVPTDPWNHKVPSNENRPFLYKVVGSGGFSPKPSVWKEFIEWLRLNGIFQNVNALDERLDAMQPDMVYKKWYKKISGGMWTYHLTYFVGNRDLYCLYSFLPNNFTMVTKYRENGLHDWGGSADFSDLEDGTHCHYFQSYPKTLNRYGWNATLKP